VFLWHIAIFLILYAVDMAFWYILIYNIE